MKSWATPQAFCLWLRYTPFVEVIQATLSLVILDKFEADPQQEHAREPLYHTRIRFNIWESTDTIVWFWAKCWETMTCQCLAENRIGADIYLLLVTCNNVKWPTPKFFYCWRTIELLHTTHIQRTFKDQTTFSGTANSWWNFPLQSGIHTSCSSESSNIATRARSLQPWASDSVPTWRYMGQASKEVPIDIKKTKKIDTFVNIPKLNCENSKF